MVRTRNDDLPHVLSVTQMAEAIGVSRSSLYVLIDEGFLSPPVYLITSHKPYFSREIAERNILARKVCIGVNGQPRIFYRRNGNVTNAQQRRGKRGSRGRPVSRNQPEGHVTALVADLKSLGLSHTSEQHVADALTDLFPSGTEGVDEGDLLRALYRKLKRQDSVR